MFRFEKMDVWKRSIAYANVLMDLADQLPPRYQFSFGEQLRRAGLSLGSNIAEGCGRGKGRDAARFFVISRGSVYEVVSILEMIRLRGLVGKTDHCQLYQEADEIARMLTRLIQRSLTPEPD